MTAEPSRQAWRGVDVGMPEVLGQLNRLRAHPRSAVMVLVAVASDPADAERAAAVVAELARHHPSRAVIVLDEPGRQESRIDAVVSAETHDWAAGAGCLYEEVFLRVKGQAAEHIPSLVDALLVPDVPSFVWWAGAPPLTSERFQTSLETADVLLLDSSRFQLPRASFASHAKLADSSPGRAFGDFAWARLAPWRELLAQFFNPPARVGFLGGIHSLEIDYAAGAGDNKAGAALLAGWLASALGWGLPKEHLELELTPVEAADGALGDVIAVRIEAAGPDGSCRLKASRDGRGHLLVEAEVRGRPVPHSVVLLPGGGEAALLSRLLVEARGDRSYPAALQAGAEVLRSTPA